MSETVGNAALQEFTEVAQSIQKLADEPSEMPAPVGATLAEKISRAMKAAHAKKRALGQSWKTKKTKRPYVRRKPIERPSDSQIDAKIDILLKQIATLRSAKELLKQ